MEILPLVDKNDEIIGEASREECHQKKLRHRTIHVFVFNPKKELLLQKRSAKKDVYPGLYEASVSGHVLKGETYENAAIREIKEEIGIIITKKDLKKQEKIEILLGPEHAFMQIFVIHTDKTPKLSDGEVQACKWVTKTELKKQIEANEKKFTPEFLAAIEHFLKR
jgi:16S rRNA (adenine1518-N6/adenine1519-N6)-dimethyltransferase